MPSSQRLEELVTLPPREKRYDNIQNLVDQVNLSEISSIRQSIVSIIRVIKNPRSTIADLKEVIQLDPPLAARVLRTANSAYYSRSFRKSFTEIEQAIIWMGSSIIMELAMNQSVCELFEMEDEFAAYSNHSLWRHSVAVATFAKAVYHKEFGLRGETAYAAGLLHDIGIIAESQFLKETFISILKLAQKNKISILEAEQEILGFNHTEIGAEICRSWDLPTELVAGIEGHSSPGKSHSRYARIASTLYLADYYCQNNGYGFGPHHRKEPDTLTECFEITDIQPHALEIILESIKPALIGMEEKGLI